MKTFLILLFIAAGGGGSWWYLNHRAEKPPEYQTVEVTEGPMTQVVTATGTLNPVINVTVGSQISGNIQELHADFNSDVKKGQVVAKLDPATYQATVNQAQGDLAQVRAALELAQLTAKRKKELVAQKAAPQADLDAALAALGQAMANVQIKEAFLEKARVDLERCTIRSPIDGTVISRSVDVGQTVAASMNAPILFTIANDLTKMQINSAVAEADVGTIEVNQEVEFSVDAFPYRTFHGTVAQVRNAATTVQNVVTYDVVVSVDNPELKLKPGMTANVSIIVAQRENAVKVPNAALRFRPPEEPGAKSAPTSPTAGGGGARPPGTGGARPGGGRPGGGRPAAARSERKVYVLPPGAAKPEAKTVKLGINDGVSTEVLEGLKPGDLVVTGVTTEPSGPSAPRANPLSGGGRRF
jgi:HlyD family secretion protein